MASRHRGPLHVYRIADRRHPLFDGTGSFLHGNRWNSKGKLVIYAAETYAGALLEMLVHSNIGFVPRTHAWIRISIPEQVSVEHLEPAQIPGWNAPDMLASRTFGDRWHQERRTAALLVPSLVTAGIESNVLLNPNHSDFHLIQAGDPQEVAWDHRLFQRP